MPGAGVGNLRARVRFEEAGSEVQGPFACWSGAVCERTGLGGKSFAQGRFGARGGGSGGGVIAGPLSA